MVYHAQVKAGRIDILDQLLAEMGIGEGDRLLIDEADGVLTIRSQRDALRRLQAYVRALVPPGVSLVDELIAERRAEAAKEEQESLDQMHRNQR